MSSVAPSRQQALDVAYHAFLDRFPHYQHTQPLDELRQREYARLDAQKHVYLDYTGGSLYAESQLQAHMTLLQNGIFGNPHSSNPSSQAMTDLDEHARSYVLRYFKADPAEYEVIFTANASAALKLVGEAYPFQAGSRYALMFDNHNSVNGIREFAQARGAVTSYIPVIPPDLRVNEAQLRAILAEDKADAPHLFAYPAQSNFSGVQHPLEWIELAHVHGFDVLLDAAAFVPTNSLDLSRWKPDFVSLSFYKMFGYPTGVGALIARKTALSRLKRPWFAGGTIEIASVQGAGYILHEGAAGFEDGTINYLMLPAVEIGLRYMESIGIEQIHERVLCLTGWLLEQLSGLKHANGSELVRVYGPLETVQRGGTITVNFYDPNGRLFDWRLVENRANQRVISLRTGCFCNPGAGEVINGLTVEDMKPHFTPNSRMSFEEFVEVMDGKLNGAVRISLGIASTFEDAYALLEFAQTLLNQDAEQYGGDLPDAPCSSV